MKKLSRACLVFALVVGGCGPEDDLQTIEENGPARGIDRRDNAPRGTVWDACNVETSQGTYKSAPGVVTLVGLVDYLSRSTNILLAEYIANPNLKHSHYNSILTAGAGSTTSANEIWGLGAGTTATVSFPSTKTAIGEHMIDGYTAAQGLWKHTVDGEVCYIPALVVSNGIDNPMVYHQTYGTGTMSELDSISGGLSNHTYLANPPRGKYLAVYKERLFMANCADAANRLYWSGANDAGVFSVNVWPASYNMDIGDSRPITGIKVWRDSLVVFKEDQIWVLSGDGVGGAWNIDLVDDGHGAVTHWAVTEVDGILMFIGTDGIYQWAGGRAENMIRDRFGDLWDALVGKLQRGVYSVRPTAAYDKRRGLVYFNTTVGGTIVGATTSTDGRQHLWVYDLAHDAWTRWGTWGGDKAIGAEDSPRMFLDSVVIDRLVFTGGYGIQTYRSEYDQIKTLIATSNPVYWFIQTRRYGIDDPNVKLLRHVSLTRRMIGGYEEGQNIVTIGVLPLVEDDGISEALRRRSGSHWGFITDTASAAEHTISHTGTAADRFDHAVDGPVDLYHVKSLYAHATNLTLVNASSTSKIKFASSQNFGAYTKGTVLVLPAGECPMARISQEESSLDILNDGFTLGDTPLGDPGFARATVGENLMGRDFALFITNSGSYSDGTYFIYPGIPSEISGWGLWLIPRGTLRPDD
jgi:hypothetical protein